jgi:hypothetical protein
MFEGMNNWEIIIGVVGASYLFFNFINGKIDSIRSEVDKANDETTRKVTASHERIDKVQQDHINLLMHLLSQKDSK